MPDSSATDAHRAELPPPRPFDKLYWLRIVCGIAAGFFSDYVWKLPGFDWTFGVTIGVGMYILTLYAARYAWYRKLEPAKQGKVYSTGIGSYVMLFLFTWILLVTLSQHLGIP